MTDFSDQKIFEGITTYPIIPILKKEKALTQFNYLKVKQSHLRTLNSAMQHDSIIVDQSSLEDEYWSFESEIERALQNKILNNKTIIELFGKCYRGILTGLNDAFIISSKKREKIINENPNQSQFLKPFLEGKDLIKWDCSGVNKWLILFPKGWTSDVSKVKDEKQAWDFMKSNYQGLATHLESYRKRAIKRYDKGEFWWELRACGYYDLFEKPKIVWPNLQSKNKFSFDNEGYYINAPSVILPTDSKVLLCIVNSKLAWFFFKKICVVRSGGYLELKPQYFEQLPVSLPSDEAPFIEKADLMLTKTKELQELKTSFLTFLQSELHPQKITKKLQNWNDLDWDGFKKELAKCKLQVKYKDLSLKERKEWQAFFAEEIQKATAFQAEIDRTDKEIDQMVYRLYELTDQEIQIVEDGG